MSADPNASRLNVPDPHIATAHMKVSRGHWAVRQFGRASRETVLKVAEAVARAAHAKAGHYADWAVRETGFGVVEHKKIKNELSSLPLLDYYRDLDLVSPRVLPDDKMVELPKPAGVIFALTPATNPVATLYYKTLMAILSRNAIVFSPHPAARECSVDAARTLAEAAETAGAPSGLIQCIEHPSVPLVQEVMASDKVAVIMATGGGAMVRAAYSSGNPALGVGPGNAVAYVDPSAKVDAAARRLIDSKSFDNSVLCTNESVVLTLDSNRGNVERALRSAGAHLCNEADTDKLRDYLFGENGFNVAAIGKSAVWIADQAGIRVSPSVRVLVPIITAPGQDDALFREKLCPVLTLASAVDFQQAMTIAAQIARRGGGHSAAFHGEAPDRLLHFSQHLPVYRVVVNAPCSQGASGFATHLPPTFMVGTGFAGRSSVGENVGPQHLVHWTRIAYNSDASVPFDQFDLSVLDHKAPASAKAHAAPRAPSALPEPDRDMLRQLILEELRGLTGGDK
ncbi:aldehyde dehydrogenase family protein [Roseovarius sp. S1116L3]|uniref:aldehyde dehydrogenase family protein n=1 Tax=Roseovarius roseus TaxID=3342636 RepID=UPI00372A24F7